MANLHLLIRDLSIVYQWTWLSQQVVINQPATVRVLCLELCDIDSFLAHFTTAGIPWSVHCNANTLPQGLSYDVVVILSHNPNAPETAIKVVAESVQHAYRARYILTHLSHVEDSDINDLGNYAWSLKLFRVVFIRLQDRAIFAAEPRCHLPKIKQIPRVEWPDLRKMDLTNCVLKVAIVNMTPYSTFDVDDESTLKGNLVPFFRFLQMGLRFKASLIPIEFRDQNKILLSDQVDLAFLPNMVKPDLPLDMSGLFFTDLSWCAPNVCVFRDTSALLWKEFTTLTWILLALSVVAISMAVKLTAALPDVSLIDALMRMIAIALAIPVRLPQGHTRWPLSGWILCTMVLGCCYQTALHSMMAAPLVIPQVRDVYELSRSKMAVACIGLTCKSLLEQQDTTEAESDLASRVQQISTLKDAVAFESADKTRQIAFFTTTAICDTYFRNRRYLPTYKQNSVLYGIIGVTQWSWLSPAVGHISSQAESSGLARLWLTNQEKQICSAVEIEKIKPISFYLLRPAIILLGVGLLLSLIVFSAEVVWFRYKLCRVSLD